MDRQTGKMGRSSESQSVPSGLPDRYRTLRKQLRGDLVRNRYMGMRLRPGCPATSESGDVRSNTAAFEVACTLYKSMIHMQREKLIPPSVKPKEELKKKSKYTDQSAGHRRCDLWTLKKEKQVKTKRARVSGRTRFRPKFSGFRMGGEEGWRNTCAESMFAS